MSKAAQIEDQKSKFQKKIQKKLRRLKRKWEIVKAEAAGAAGDRGKLEKIRNQLLGESLELMRDVAEHFQLVSQELFLQFARPGGVIDRRLGVRAV